MHSLRKQFLQYQAQTNDIPLMLEIDRADGVYLFDKHGNKYLDLISGISVSALGHQNPTVINAIKEQVDRHLHVMVYGEFIQSPQVQYAKWLSDKLGGNLNSVYFTNSGAEATEGAMKLAKRYTGRPEIISCRNAYHGSTQGALSIAGGEWLKTAFRPLLPSVKQIEFNSIIDLDKISELTACVIVEPIQAEAGVLVPSKGYMLALRQKCSETGCLLVFDEIQTAFGRTGYWFYLQHLGVEPDILLLGKALGGGMPLGAFIASNEMMNTLSFNPVLGHITTFGGHPVSCAAGLAMCQEIEKMGFMDSVTSKAQVFTNQFEQGMVRHAGFLMALEVGDFYKVKKLVKHCIDNYLVVDWFLFNDRSIRIAPPLVITQEELLRAAEVINEGLKKL